MEGKVYCVAVIVFGIDHLLLPTSPRKDTISKDVRVGAIFHGSLDDGPGERACGVREAVPKVGGMSGGAVTLGQDRLRAGDA